MVDNQWTGPAPSTAGLWIHRVWLGCQTEPHPPCGTPAWGVTCEGAGGLPITHLDGRALQHRFDSLGDHVNVGLPLGRGVRQVQVRGLRGHRGAKDTSGHGTGDTNPVTSPSPRCILLCKTHLPLKSRTLRQGEVRAGRINALAKCFSPFNLTLEKIKPRSEPSLSLPEGSAFHQASTSFWGGRDERASIPHQDPGEIVMQRDEDRR